MIGVVADVGHRDRRVPENLALDGKIPLFIGRQLDVMRHRYEVGRVKTPPDVTPSTVTPPVAQ